MKNNKQLYREHYDIFSKATQKRCEAIYTIINREEKQTKANLWLKYLNQSLAEIESKIQFNNDLLATISKRN